MLSMCLCRSKSSWEVIHMELELANKLSCTYSCARQFLSNLKSSIQAESGVYVWTDLTMSSRIGSKHWKFMYVAFSPALKPPVPAGHRSRISQLIRPLIRAKYSISPNNTMSFSLKFDWPCNATQVAAICEVQYIWIQILRKFVHDALFAAAYVHMYTIGLSGG